MAAHTFSPCPSLCLDQGSHRTLTSVKGVAPNRAYLRQSYKRPSLIKHGRPQHTPVECNAAATTSIASIDEAMAAPVGSSVMAGRLLQVGVAAVRFVAVLLANRGSSKTEAGSSKKAQQMQNILTKLGPAFVKLAQTLSMRPDLIGDEYASALAELQDNVAAFPNEVAFKILEEELGRPTEEVFSSISPEPVASASLGQVYKGELRPEFGGALVAIKIQRPGVLESVTLDVQLLRHFLGVVQRVAGITRDLRGLADEVGRGLIGECDFRNEASNAEEFVRLHKHMEFIMVPRILHELTTKRLLVSEWVEGRSPTQLFVDPSKPAKQALLNMVQMGIQCSLSQLLVTGYLHGDPHSGNLLLCTDGRLCYLDFGLVVNVSEKHRQAMMAALVHLGLGEWDRLVRDLDQMDLLKADTDKVALAEDLEKEFAAVLNEGGDGDVNQLPLLSLQNSQLSFSLLTAVLFRIAFRYRFLLPPYFPLIVRSVSSLEGIALSIDPKFKLVSAGMPVVLTQLLSDRRPAARALLKELLLSDGEALRADDTIKQILKVWLNAAQQAVNTEVLVSCDEVTELSTDATLGTSEAAVNLTSLLLDQKHVPLRRTLIEVNPAATISSMSPQMRAELIKVLTEALSGTQTVQAAVKMFKNSAAARAQRKRLFILLQASVPKVLKSPPASVLALVRFTAAVVAGVLYTWLRQVFQQTAGWIFGLFTNKKGSPKTVPSTP